jgi:iron complex outermembrane receptor protein
MRAGSGRRASCARSFPGGQGNALPEGTPVRYRIVRRQTGRTFRVIDISVRARALLQSSAATAALGLGLIAAPALAQTAEAETAASDFIVVTGSRIARPNIEGAAPVTVLSQEEFTLRGAVNVEELLFDTPQIAPSLGGNSNNPGDGRAILDLRGLGANRTLILVNGRRWISSGPGQIVDVNTIPVALIQRAEVLTGGRSAVYGSDAVAGVVNFITRSDFEGVAADAGYRITTRGDGGTFDANLAIGANVADGRGNVTLFVGYTDRNSILQGAREFSRRSRLDDGQGGFFFGGSGAVEPGRIVVGGFQTGNPATNNWNIPRPAAIPANDNLFLSDGSVRPFNVQQDQYNYAPVNYLQLPQTRWLAGAFANFEVNQHLDVYGEVVYTNNRTVSQLAPTPITGNSKIRVDNPFLSPALRAAFAQMDANQARTINLPANTGQSPDQPNDGFITANFLRRMTEVGPRVSDRERQAFRVLTGVRGEISGDWRYDLYYSYGRTTDNENQFGNVSRSRYNFALAGCPAGAPAGCTPINIFGAGNISQAAARYVKVDTKNTNTVTEQVLNATVSNGNLFSLGLGADPVGIAVGAEKRWVQGEFRPDFVLASGDVVGFNAGTQTVGGYDVAELFGEVNIPIAADTPGFHRLEVNGAVRYSDYSNATGGVFTWGAQGLWAPIRDVTFRGSYQRAIRAPTVNDLFLGQSEGFPGFSDYCRTGDAATNATLRQSCINNGVPAALVGTPFGSGNTQIRAIFGGNPNLKEETADTWTVGVVLAPTFAPGLTLTVDYYDIEIQDAILGGGPGVTNTRDACFGTPANGYQPFDTSFCALLPRNQFTFDIDGAINTAVNAGFVKTRGIDFELSYGIPVGFGLFGADDSRLQFRVAGNRLLQWDINNIAAIPALLIECEGEFGLQCGASYPEWKINGTIGWATGPALFNVRVNYKSGMDDDGALGFVPWKPRIKDYATVDFAASFDIDRNFNISFGIINLTDRDPPLLAGNAEQANTYPSDYDVLGRRLFIRAGLRF